MRVIGSMVVSVTLAAGTAFAADAAKESATTNAVGKVDFAEICAKGSLKGVTDRGAMSYAVSASWPAGTSGLWLRRRRIRSSRPA